MNTATLMRHIARRVTDLGIVIQQGSLTSAVEAGARMGSEPVMSELKLFIDGKTFLVQVHRLTAGSEHA
jgi:hypothetical protein